MKISADCLSISSGIKGVPPVADVVKCMAERNPFEPSNMFQEINGSNTETQHYHTRVFTTRKVWVQREPGKLL